LDRAQRVDVSEDIRVKGEDVIDGSDVESCRSWREVDAVKDGEGEIDFAVEIRIRSEDPSIGGVAGDGACIGNEVDD